MAQQPSHEHQYGQTGQQPQPGHPQSGHPQPGTGRPGPTQPGQYPQQAGQHDRGQAGYSPGPSPASAPAGNGGAPPLSQPMYGASFGQAISRFFKKYARFSGYASRSEYWWVFLATSVLALVLGGTGTGIMASLIANSENMQTTSTSTSVSFEAEGGAAIALLMFGLVSAAIGLALVIPHLALSWRRLHDAGFPGPLWLLWFIPGVGWIIVLILMLMPTNAEKRRPEWDDPARD